MDPDEWTLRRDGTPIKLEHKEFEVLLYLVDSARNGKKLSRKDELKERFWRETLSSAEANLSSYIREIRRKIGLPGADYIQTEPKEGYRFEVVVTDRAHISDGDCPWVGLPPIDERHGEFFCGREKQVNEVVAKLEQSNFLVVIGGSGLGKSSLIRAGLVPLLEKDVSTGTRWNCRVFEPTISPLTKLASELIELTGKSPAKDQVESLANTLNSTCTGVQDYLEATPWIRARVLLVVDQFENFIRRYEGTNEQNAFIDNLLHAASTPDHKTSVIFVVRTDFYHRLEQYPKLWPQVVQHQWTILKISSEGLREAIECPAQRVGLQLDDGLVDAILDDLQEAPGALSMVSQTMVELFKRRQGTRLTSKAYREIGRVQEIINNKAEQVFATFDAAEQERVRQILINITYVGEQPENDLKGRVDLDDLVTDLDDYDQIMKVIGRLTDERLLVTSTDYETSSVHEDRPRVWVEASHDALIRYWPRARNWLNEKRGAKLMFDTLDTAVKEWQQGKDSANLFRGSKLDTFLDSQSTFIEFVRPIHSEFLDASRRLRDQERVEEDQRRRANEQRRKWKRIAVVAGIAVLISMTTVFFFKRQRDLANSLRWAANANAQLQSDPELSLLLATEAANLAPTTESTTALRGALAAFRLRAVYVGHRAQVISVALSPNGKYLLTGGADNEARLWDLFTGNTIQTFIGHTDWVNWADFSPDGKLIVTASRDATIRIWDIETGHVIKELHGHDKSVNDARFSHDGSKILTAGEDGTAKVWDSHTGNIVLTLEGHKKYINTAIYSVDGNFIATASGDGTVKVWNSNTGASIATVSSPVGTVIAVAFSPDGKRIATGGSDKTTYIWSTETWQKILELRGHSQQVNSVQFSADGHLILTASKDGTAHIWDSRTGADLFDFRGHTSGINNAIFNPDSRFVFTTSGDKTARMWSSQLELPKLSLEGHSDSVFSAIFSPDGKKIVTASKDRTARIWDAVSGRQLMVLRHSDSVQNAIFSPDGRLIATASHDGKARLFDSSTGELKRELSAHSEMVHSIGFSPDGTKLITASKDLTARVRDVNTGSLIRVLGGHTKQIYHVGYSPDAKWIATAGHDNQVILWNSKTYEPTVKFNVGTGVFNSVNFSRDSNFLLAACGDQTARIWNLNDFQSVAVLRGHEGWVNYAEFSPDGQLALTASSDGIARLWEIGHKHLLYTFADQFSSLQTAAFSPDGKMIVLADFDGGVKLYDCELCSSTNSELISRAEHLKIRGLTSEEKALYLELPSAK